MAAVRRSMTRRLHECALIAALVALFSCQSQVQHVAFPATLPLRPARLQAHPIELQDQYPIVRLRTASGDVIRLVFDTGTDGLILTRDAVELCPDAKSGEVVRVFLDGRWTSAQKVTIGTLKWDEELLTNVVATMFNRDDSRLMSRTGIDGLMGIGATAHKFVAIDYLRSEILLGEDGDRLSWGVPAVTVPIQFHRHIPCVDASLGEAVAHVALDTGSPATIIGPELWSKAALGETQRRRSPTGEEIEGGFVRQIRVGKLAITGMAVIRRKPILTDSEYDGILGNLFFYFAGRVKLDYQNRKASFYWENPDAAWNYLKDETAKGTSWAPWALSRLSGIRSPMPSNKERLEWLSAAVERGHTSAAYDLGMAWNDGLLGLEKNPERAYALFSKAAASGHSRAKSQAGYMCREGDGTRVDAIRAHELTREAALAGELDAQNDLGWNLVFGGRGVEKDLSEGFRWLLRAAKRGVPEAQSNVGICYKDGLGVSKDPIKAIEWYTKSANKGNASAMYNLGEAYKLGIDGQVDLTKAKDWYGKAAANGHEGAKRKLKELDAD